MSNVKKECLGSYQKKIMRRSSIFTLRKIELSK
jgi:hypothetical protein